MDHLHLHFVLCRLQLMLVSRFNYYNFSADKDMSSLSNKRICMQDNNTHKHIIWFLLCDNTAFILLNVKQLQQPSYGHYTSQHLFTGSLFKNWTILDIFMHQGNPVATKWEGKKERKYNKLN